MEAWVRIDVLVNTAGHGPKGPILNISDEDWHDGVEVYLMNVVRPSRIVPPILIAQSCGAISNVSASAAFEPDPPFPTAGVFRAGLAAFSRLYPERYAAENMRMNTVLPGFIDTLAGDGGSPGADRNGPIRAHR